MGLVVPIVGLAATGAVAAIQYYFHLKLSKEQAQANLIKESLSADDEDERLESLEFLIDINLITDPKLKEALAQYRESCENGEIVEPKKKLPRYLIPEASQPNTPANANTINNNIQSTQNTVHGIIGSWEYTRQQNGEPFFRTFTTDKMCRLSSKNQDIIWEYPYEIMNDREITVTQQLYYYHELLDNGKLRLFHEPVVEDISMLKAACTATKISESEDDVHDIVGTWEYEKEGKKYTRTFTSDDKCILSEQGSPTVKTRTYRVNPDNDRRVRVVARQLFLYHKIRSDGQLNIENRYIATRATLESGSSVHDVDQAV
ncbi:hypothetical protein [Candidatus Albibeggiatoa sp. nov. NOAA]|uniref:hypothetical protein n=1 Tax=Candidatus Albibeggiatoa sp. nov. NOAA TaxID=3162724 RepID=UPI003305151E|nr:hypothetical protein [Thiotrichaceae bacterium]